MKLDELESTNGGKDIKNTGCCTLRSGASGSVQRSSLGGVGQSADGHLGGVERDWRDIYDAYGFEIDYEPDPVKQVGFRLPRD
jgi:hypothetical protein